MSVALISNLTSLVFKSYIKLILPLYAILVGITLYAHNEYLSILFVAIAILISLFILANFKNSDEYIINFRRVILFLMIFSCVFVVVYTFHNKDLKSITVAMENKHDYLFLFLLVVIAPVLEMVRRND
jgi:hypothetical protein